MRKWFKNKNKSRQPSPHPVRPKTPPPVDTPPPNIGRKLSPADTVSNGKLSSLGVEINLTTSAGVDDAWGSQIVLPRDDDGYQQSRSGDDVTRGYADGKADDDGPLERDDEETPSNVLDHKHFLPNIPSERIEPEALDRREYGAIVERPTKTPLTAFSDHGGGDAPDSVRPSRSERER